MVGSMDDNNIINAENAFEIQKLKEEIRKLSGEISKYKILLKEFDEDANISGVSDAEIVCVEQLAKLRQYSKQRELTADEIKNLDTLHKNLKLARGESIRGSSGAKAKSASDKELEKIIKGK